MITDRDIKKIAQAVWDMKPKDEDAYTLTAKEKAQELRMSYSRFMQTYKALGIPYKKEPGTRRVLFRKA